MAGHLLLLVRTALHRYIVSREDVLELKLVSGAADLQVDDPHGRACVGAELGPLLDPADQSGLKRRHALIIPLRRRLVALLADQVELFQEHARIEPLPALLKEHLRQPWAIGALLLDTDVIVQLDLREVARTVLLRQPSEP